MNSMQAKVLELVKEIDATCRQQGLAYALYGKTAGRACKDGSFFRDDVAFDIMMYACDMPKLKAALLGEGRPGRAIEDLVANAKLAGNSLRYVDTDTTLLSRNDPVRYEHLGVAVTIHPVYTSESSRIARTALFMLAHCNGGVEYDASELTEKQQRVIRWGGNAPVMSFAARRAHAALAKDPGDRAAKKQWLCIDGRMVDAGQGLLDETIDVNFEGLRLPVSRKVQKHLGCLYGKKVDAALGELETPSGAFATIMDAEMPYEEALVYLKENGVDLRNIQDVHYRNHLWRCNVLVPVQRQKSSMYRNALLARDRIDYYVETEPKLPKLREAYAADDVERLEELLGRYFHFTRKYIKRGVGFFTTQELFDMASKVWLAKTGSGKYAGKVYKRIPKPHLEMDIKAHVDRYREGM